MSIGAILTQGFGSFGQISLVPTLGFGAGAPIPPEPPAGDELLGGGPGYSYITPYQKLQHAKKEVVEVKAAIDHAAIERKALQDKLEKALQSKAKKAAETQRKLELKLQQLEKESLRLLLTLQNLEALMRMWDEEDAILVLLMSSPL